MQAYPLYPARKRTDLAGFWDFLFLPQKMMKLSDFASPAGLAYHEFQTVPGCFDAAGTYVGQRGIGVYRRSVEVSRDGLVRLEIGGISISAKIFWDGKEIALDDLPYSGVNYEFRTSAGFHELVIAVENAFDVEFNPLFHPWYDFYAFGGILRSIALVEMPQNTPASFGRCSVTTLDWKSGRVRLDVELDHFSTSILPLSLMVAFDGAAPQEMKFERKADNLLTLDVCVPDPKPWSLSAPNLHTVTLSFPDDSDVLIERFGIRMIEAKNGHFYLNDEPIYPAGYNRHESHPQFGSCLPLAVMMEDLQILRSMHCNFIRGCHYPQSQLFLDLCDQMGILVWEESLGWGNGPETLNSEKFRAKQVEQTALMVRNSRNHPSVILWGFLNECESSSPAARTLVAELVKTIKDFDTSRPVTFATKCISYGEQCLDLVDVISCNTYPGWYGVGCCEDGPIDMIAGRLDDVEKEVSTDAFKDKPMILSEIGAAALYGCHDRTRIQWSEEFQDDYISEVIRQLQKRPRFQGLALWHFADARTYSGGSSLNRARGFNNKGSLDEYRREKMVAETIRRKMLEPPFSTAKE